MNRLTIEQLENYRNTYDKFDGIESNVFERICDELIEYKSLEEELGIDLITLFKALNSCWFKYNFEIIGDIRPSLRFINGEWCLISNIKRIVFPYPLRLYGKIWSLDRGE